MSAMNKCQILALAAALLLCLTATSSAQQQAQQPQQCSEATSLNWNNTDFFQPMYEVARTPNNTQIGCVLVLSKLLPDNSTLQINSTFAGSSSSWYMNVTERANVALVQGATTGYNVTFNNGMTNAPAAIYKILNFNSTWGFLAGCAYTNATNNATSFGFILSTKQMANMAWLQEYNNALAANFTNFNSTLYTVPQSNQCYTSGAVTRSLPLFATFAAVLLALLKLN